jgi:hypothetical protein
VSSGAQLLGWHPSRSSAGRAAGREARAGGEWGPDCTGYSPGSCECGCAVRRCPFGKSKSPAHSIPVQVPMSSHLPQRHATWNMQQRCFTRGALCARIWPAWSLTRKQNDGYSRTASCHTEGLPCGGTLSTQIGRLGTHALHRDDPPFVRAGLSAGYGTAEGGEVRGLAV